MEYQKVLSATMIDLQVKVLNSKQKSTEKKVGGHGPSNTLAQFPWPCIIYISYEISFCFKVNFFFQDALEVDLETFCEAMELPRK